MAEFPSQDHDLLHLLKNPNQRTPGVSRATLHRFNNAAPSETNVRDLMVTTIAYCDAETPKIQGIGFGPGYHSLGGPEGAVSGTFHHRTPRKTKVAHQVVQAVLGWRAGIGIPSTAGSRCP